MSSSEDYSEEIRELLGPDTPPTSPRAMVRRHEEVIRIGQTVLDMFPLEPGEDEPPIEILLYNYYYAVQYMIHFTLMDGVTRTCSMSDSIEMIQDLAYCVHLKHCYEAYRKAARKMASELLDKLALKLNALPTDGALLYFINELCKYKEMHTRPFKRDPSAKKTYNAVTDEEFDHTDPKHKSWRQIILNPLPSDLDPNAIDHNEGGEEHAMALHVAELNGELSIPPPFSIIVTVEWSEIIRLLHFLIFHHEYVTSAVLSAIPSNLMTKLSHGLFIPAWREIMGDEDADVPLKKLSRKKAGKPPIVSVIAEIRDLWKNISTL